MTSEIALFPEGFDHGPQVDLLFFFLLSVCGAVGLLVAVLLIYFSVRYRRRPGDFSPPPATAQPRWLEWTWTIAPMFVFALMFLWGAVVYVRAFNAPEDSAVVYVVASNGCGSSSIPRGSAKSTSCTCPSGGR